MDSNELSHLEKLKLSNIKIISTTGTPSDTIVICDGHELQGIKSIRFEIDKTLLVGKAYIEIYIKDITIDAKSIETEVKEIKE